ncbi:hypothetical protein EQV77_00365 [Halobacillus fulvus]|nr:hypothetical protein EQV77_00365 [Halobacillus fulvus]
MHIPPYFNHPQWRRLFAGIMIGAFLGYLFFLIIHGQTNENLMKEHMQLSAQLHDAEEKYQSLLNNPKENTQHEPVKVKELDISFTNAKKMEIDLLTQHELNTLVQEQLSSVPGNPLNTAATQAELMISTVENKSYKVDHFTYQLKVKRLVISEVVSFQLEIQIDP